MTTSDFNSANDISALQQRIQELEAENKKLADELNQKIAVEQQLLAELARLYQQVTGQMGDKNWNVRDYVMGVYYYLDNIIALAPGHIFWLDKNNVYLGCNNAQAKSENLDSRHAIAGKRNKDIFSLEFAQALDATNNKVMHSGQSIILEEHGETFHGPKVFLSEKVPLKDNTGNIIGLLGTAVNITELKNNIKALERVKQQIESTNRARTEFLRLMQQELTTLLTNIMQHIQEESIIKNIERTLQLFDDIVQHDEVLLNNASATVAYHEEKLLNSDENEFTLENVYKLKEKNKQLQKTLERSLHENKQLHAIQQRENLEFSSLYQQVTGQSPQQRLVARDYALAVFEYLDNVIAMAPGSIFWMDKNNVCLGCNELQAKIAGLPSRKAMIGKTNWDLPWKDQAATLEKINNQVMESGKILSIEETVNTPEGQLTFLSKKAPLRNSQGEIIGLLGISLDITEQKQAMEILALAKRKAEEASWAKSEFIQNMSHDLKTPLMTVMGMAELLSLSEKDNARQGKLQIIHRAGKRMVDIFTSILEAASIDSQEAKIKQEPVNLKEIFQGLAELYEPLAHEKNIALNMEVSPAIPEIITSDSMHIQRILLNLIGNALKFTQDGNVTVNATAETIEKQPFVVLTVADTGIGMPADKLELIFEKFVRLTSSYTGTYSGTGLGLGIVKRFVTELGGTINVSSEEGKGSTFTCKIPY